MMEENKKENGGKRDDNQDTCIALMKQSIDNIEKKLKDVPTKEEVKLAVIEGVEKVIQKCDQRYADKETEKIVKGAAWVVLLAVLGVLITLVVVKVP
jgi:hypothetical protein